ncbi:hypothetical protein JCM3766R1_007127 [Sporobolomyces carnicolor]
MTRTERVGLSLVDETPLGTDDDVAATRTRHSDGDYDYTDQLEELVKIELSVPLARIKQRGRASTSSDASTVTTPRSLIPRSTTMLRGDSNSSQSSNNDNHKDKDNGWETLQLGRKRAQSTSPRTPDPSTRATTRQPYSNRTNLDRSPCRPNTTKTKTTPSPARQKGPVARRKSTSAATATPREFSSYDLSSLPPEAFATSTTTTTTTTTARSKPPPPSQDDPSRPPPPPPSRRRQPRQLEDDETEFKDGDGSFPYFTADATLRVSSDTSVETAHPLIYKNSRGELTDRGREEDKIIPTIANRLEAERRQKLVELAQRQQQQQQQRQRRRQHDDDDPTTQRQERGQGGVDRHEQRRRQEEAVDKDVGPQENPSRSSNVAISRDGVTTTTRDDESSRPLAELSSSSSPANEKTAAAAATTTPRVGVAVADNTDSNDKTRHSDVVDKDANKATCCACVIS